jgi:hypothetical protein
MAWKAKLGGAKYKQQNQINNIKSKVIYVVVNASFYVGGTTRYLIIASTKRLCGCATNPYWPKADLSRHYYANFLK